MVFSEPVQYFYTSNANDVILSGTAGANYYAITDTTGTGQYYDVAVSGMTQTGTVTATIPGGKALDHSGNSNLPAPTPALVTYDITQPTVTISPAAGQKNPTNTGPVHFAVVFSKQVLGFSASSVTITSSGGGTLTDTFTGSGPAYDVMVSGMTGSCQIVANVAAGAVHDVAGNGNSASTGSNLITYDVTPPTVTINQAANQADPTSQSTIHFTAVFSKPVFDFSPIDVNLSGTAKGSLTDTITGSGTTYDVAVTGMQGSGTVIATIPAGQVHDAPGNVNLGSTSTDNSVTYVQPTLLRFDFGTPTSPAESGFTPVSPKTKYTAKLGYGWKSGTILASDAGTGSNLDRDCNYTKDGVFVANLPSGQYQVSMDLAARYPPRWACWFISKARRSTR